jgi:ubiquinone/menaquinone biosynthesis C-methylase UbiE
MMKFSESSASSEELYEWCIKEYSSNNVISRILINNFYEKLRKVIIIPILPQIRSIIEIGCGAGESTKKILKMVCNVKYEATEYDLRYIDALNNKNLPFKISQENVYGLNKEENSYDCVIMLEVLEHLENYELALKEIFRVSRKYVIISVPNEPIWRILNILRFKYVKQFGNTPGHINHWGSSELRQLITKYGLIVKMAMPLPWLIIIAKKYGDK